MFVPTKWTFNFSTTPPLRVPVPLSYATCSSSLFLLQLRNQVTSVQQHNLGNTHNAVFSSLVSFLPPYLPVFPSEEHSQCSHSPSIYSCTVS